MALIDQGEFEAPRCDKDLFCAKMTVSTSIVVEHGGRS